METLKRDRTATSMRVLEGRKQEVSAHSQDIAGINEVAPGIFEVKAIHEEHPPLLIAGGIHGDEKAGIAILDHIIGELAKVKTKVRRSLLLVYGNLEAMRASDFMGARCVEPEKGELSNLNRCFGRGLFENPETYAQRRANEITEAVESFVSRFGVPDVIDIHQSFAVPSLRAVRAGPPDRSDYTYAMAYPVHGEGPSLSWFYESYSDIVAAVVLNDMACEHHTFAGYMASAYGANAATFEQGTIGYIDFDTFVPQLQRNLLRKIGGEERLRHQEGYDVWRVVRSVAKQTEDFHFVDSDCRRTDAPVDFLPLRRGDRGGTVAVDGDTVHELTKGERPLFANANVPIGDRALAVVVPHETDVIPRPE
ncbi:MAG: succinylglutamate desuccinylase/aspartoacylase family protein [Candidatus Paceibacterota bacterium]